jgi:superfamily I DNA/RNA helicase/RecB family exonuclease
VSHPTPPRYRLVRPVSAPAVEPRLDAAQRAVLGHPGGPLLVLAGPGTGKTTTLVETAVARVNAGVPVEHILMVTFSRRAAAEMRERVTARLNTTVREPIARTVHSYAFGVLRMAALINRHPAPRLLAAAEQDVVIRDLLGHSDIDWPAALRPALRTEGFATQLRDLLMRAIERGLDAPRLHELGRRQGRPDWIAAAAFLREYQGVTVLRDPSGYDPAELIRAALSELRANPQLLTDERARRRHILVDEFQDIDPAQAELLAVIGDGAAELILVGDPDQSIYAFRGADQGAIRDVDERFGRGAPVPRVPLRTARRAGRVLLAGSRRIATLLPGRGEQRELVTDPQRPPGELAVGVFRTASEEAAHLAGELRRAYLHGLPWSRMAVLVRSTASALGPLRRAMITAGVPVTVRSADLPLADQPAVAMLLDVLQYACAPETLSEPLAEALLAGPVGGADSVYLRRLRRVLAKRFGDEAGQLVPVVTDPVGAEVLPEHVKGPVRRVARVLSAARDVHAAGANAEEVLWAAWAVTGLATRWELASAAGGTLGAAADRDLDAVVALFDAAARYVDRLPGEGPAGFVAYVRDQQLPVDALAGPEPQPEAVSILTAHASKGLEWDFVCVASVQEGSWPDLRRRGSLLGTEELVDLAQGIDPGPAASSAVQLAEERRLFYVAITRARTRLLVTAVAGEDEQPSRFLDELDPFAGERRPLGPARGVHLPGLVAELRAVTCDPAAAALDRRAAARELARLAQAGVPGADPQEWWGLAPLSTTAGPADPDRPIPISPSGVESFLTCELNALMRGFGVDDRESSAAELGNVIHDIAANAEDGQTMADLRAALHVAWDQINFAASWFADNEHQRAEQMLATFASWLASSRSHLTHLGSELDFQVEVGDARISGRVDRLERDSRGRLVVIDLKTGQSKPKADELPAHPQLGTYQLAIEHGAFASLGTEPGGAVLVQLAKPARGNPEQVQQALGDSADPGWARAVVEQMAARLRGGQFRATENRRCQICDVRTSCPLQPAGGQVPS